MPLHPQARSFLDLVAKKNVPTWEDLDPSMSRSLFNGLTDFFGQGPELKSVSDEPFDAPLRAYKLEGLPFIQIITAEYDVLRDEGERYTDRLKDAGVEVELIRYGGMLHGFIHLTSVFDDGKKALADLGKAIKTRIA